MHLPIAVNLSARNLEERDLAEAIRELLADAGLAAGALEIELTESSLMRDPQRALQVLSALSAAGVRISIDDFGTGYSSLSYLKQLPVNELKIDRSFVRDMATDTSDRTIVRAIVDLAHNLGLTVVAEGVEEPQIWRLLASLGCDQAQGYLISRPLVDEALMEWLANHAAQRLDLAA